jgi:small subunit ribosomal protein S16
MALKIRLRRMGRKKAPTYRIVVAESLMPRDGRFVDRLGHYNPRTEPITLVVDREKALAWLAQGAIPTETVRSLLKKAGVFSEQPVTEQILEAPRAAAGRVAETVRDAAAAVAGAASRVAATVAEAAGDAVEAVRETAGDAAEAIRETAGDAVETVRETAADVVEEVRERVGGDEAEDRA